MTGSKHVAVSGRGILWQGRLLGAALSIEDQPQRRARLTVHARWLGARMRVPYRFACWCYDQGGSA